MSNQRIALTLYASLGGLFETEGKNHAWTGRTKDRPNTFTV